MIYYKIKAIALIAIIIFAVMYLLCSFIAWEINAGNWEEGGRFLFVIIFSVLVAVLSINHKLMEKE